MSVLDKLKAKVAEKSSFVSDGESPFLQLKDGDAYIVRFLQEFDEDVADERRGQIKVVEEHTSPKDFKIRAECTLEQDGRCWACEQVTLPEVGRQWRSKMIYYVNVAVMSESDGKTLLDAPKVKIFKHGFGKSSTGPLLIEYTEEYGSLLGQEFKLSRKGKTMNDTTYSLIPKGPTKVSKEVEALEVRPFDRYIKHVPYDQQSAFYAGQASDDASADW